MKNNKGITLAMLVIYIILTMIVLGILTAVTGGFRSNLNDLNRI